MPTFVIAFFFLLFCILLLYYGHSLNILEFVSVLWVLLMILLYAFYFSKRILHEESFVAHVGMEDVDQEDNRVTTEEEDEACYSTTFSGCCHEEIMQEACEDEMKGYVTSNIWEKLKRLPGKMANNIIVPLKELTSSFASGIDSEPKDDDNVAVDFVRAENNPKIYHALGVFQNAHKTKTEDIDTVKLDEVENKIQKLNHAFFYIKNYNPNLFQKLQTFFLDDNK